MNRKIIENSDVCALGSRMVYEPVTLSGATIPAVSTVIRLSKEKFLESYNGDDGYKKLKERCDSFSFFHNNSFFRLLKSDAVDEYAVYTFAVGEEWTSLGKITDRISNENALEIFRRIIFILREYADGELCRNGYNPLSFICRDSVFLSFDKDGRVNGVKLLPLLFENDCGYIGMSSLAKDGRADITTDIYMAAYLYLLIKYPSGEAFNKDEYSQFDQLAECCLSVFPQRRLSLDELILCLSVGENKTCEKTVFADEKEDKEKSKKKAKNEVSVVGADDEIDEDFYDLTPAALSNFLKERYASLKGIFADVSVKLSNAKEKLSSSFSTEDGDNEDEDK